MKNYIAIGIVIVSGLVSLTVHAQQSRMLPQAAYLEPMPGVFVHRTPDERFADLNDFPFEPHYIEIDGLRMHYLDEGTGDAGTFLLMHGEPTWSYLYRDWISTLTAAGYRTIAPDMIGFGKSDKVIDRDWYTVDRHVDMLTKFVTGLDLQNITIVVQDWGGPTGLLTVVDLPERFARLIILNTWLHHDDYEYTPVLVRWNVRSKNTHWTDWTTRGPYMPPRQLTDRTAYGAPFDHENATAGAERWPWMLPFAQPEAGAAERQAAAFAALASWDKPAHVVFGDRDTTFTAEWGREFAEHIPGATFDTVEGVGHWVQEVGAPLAELILQRISEE